MNDCGISLVQAVEIPQSCSGLLISAGAGIGVNSGLPEFRGKEGFWRAYPALATAGIDFFDIATPRWFVAAPETAWGFYGHRLKLYRDPEPHAGFQIHRQIGDAPPDGYLYIDRTSTDTFRRPVSTLTGSMRLTARYMACNAIVLVPAGFGQP